MTASECVEISAAGRLVDEAWLVFEPSPRRVRTVLDGKTIADSNRMMLLHEKGHLPVYYFPQADVTMALLEPSEHTTQCPYKGEARYWTVRAGGAVAENAAWSYPNPIAGAAELAGYIALYWGRMDAWYEEDEEVFVHARDPYKRVDVVQSSRHVRVVLAGEVVAESAAPGSCSKPAFPPATNSRPRMSGPISCEPPRRAPDAPTRARRSIFRRQLATK